MMSKQPNPLDQAVDTCLGQINSALGAHPTREEWKKYLTQALDQNTQERYQDHLLGCEECLETLGSLRFEPEAVGAHQVTEFESASVRRLLRYQLEKVSATATPAATAGNHSVPANATESGPRPTSGPGQRGKLGSLLMAASLACCLGAGGAWHLRGGELDDLRQPNLSSHIDTVDANVYRNSSGAIRFKTGTNTLTLEIIWPSQATYSHYQVILRNAEGDKLWTSPLQDSPPESLVIHRSWIPGKSLEVVLSGSDRGATEPLRSFPITLS